MSIIGLFVLLIMIGIAVYVVNTYLPIAPPIKQIIVIVAVLIALLLVLQAFGILGSLNAPVPRVN